MSVNNSSFECPPGWACNKWTLIIPELKNMKFSTNNNQDTKSNLIRRITQANSNDGSKSNRKSHSITKTEPGPGSSGSKHNITNSIIMRRQLNAIKDLSPPRNNFSYAFIYDINPSSSKSKYGYEKKVLQQISKSKPRINQPSPNKKIRRYVNNKLPGNNPPPIRDFSFNSTIKNTESAETNQMTHRSTKRKSRKNGKQLEF